MNPGLDALIHPRPRAEFLGSYQASEPFVVHGLTSSVSALFEIPCLESLELLLKSWPSTVQVQLPDAADEVSSITASPQDARKLFDNGMSLLFDDIHALSPMLVLWMTALRMDLGLSALTHSRCLTYATPKGGGTAPHFDQNVNFVLQLHGTKTWWLAPNTNVVEPMTRHTMGSPIDPELASYAAQPMPSAMPEDRRTIVLEPGSMLFVPRGVWHATEAASEALSLNFTYSAPTWIDVFSAALRSRLALSSEWRKTAVPARAQELELLLRELATDVPSWNAVDILAATEPASSDHNKP